MAHEASSDVRLYNDVDVRTASLSLSGSSSDEGTKGGSVSGENNEGLRKRSLSTMDCKERMLM